MKIVCLSTYPIESPRHGGQHRLHNIIELLKQAGHDVYSAGVCGSPVYPPSPYFAKFPGKEVMEGYSSQVSLMEDVIIGDIFEKSEKYFNNLANLIPKNPDVIICEQPWLFGFALRYKAMHRKKNIKIVYGSQNIEHKLKFEMVNYHFGEKIAQESRDKVLACEVRAIEQSDRTVCVSVEDAHWAADYADKPPIIAPNGVIDRVAGMEDVAKANNITGARKFALYCASAHPPNMDGFFDMFGYGVGCFPPDARMVVAGGAGHHILHDPKYAQVGGIHKIYVNAGEVSESILRGLLATAHQIVLPITHGGGTNLKAAEAIWAGCHVVTTATAMRGFEQFVSAEGITVADDSASFCAAIRDAFLKPRLHLSQAEREERQVVLWNSVLADLVRHVGELKVA